MNLMDLFIKIGVDDQASRQVDSISKKLGNGLKTAAKIGTAAVAAAGTGITALVTKSVQAYADYEQLVGGAELMFGDAYDFIMKKSQDAYKNVQMSQNEYLQQVNGFATGLKTALNGNAQAAAELADKILKAEADIVAATGQTQEAVQNAFNGIMKSNYTMLDNLLIGITPTKKGFQEIINKVNEWNAANGRATSYQINNLADAQSALVDYIEMIGMSGYSQEEASKTITGSISSAKAAWQNWLTALSIGTEETEERFDSLVSSVKTVVKNLTPAISTAVSSINGLVSSFADEFINAGENEDTFVDVGYNYLHNILDGVNDSFKYGGGSKNKIAQFLSKLGDELTDTNNLGTLMLDVKQLATNIINGIADASSEEGAGKILDNITAVLNDPSQLESSGELGKALANLIASVLDFGDREAETIGDKIENALLAGVRNGSITLQGFGKALWESFLQGFEKSMEEDGILKAIFEKTTVGSIQIAANEFAKDVWNGTSESDVSKFFDALFGIEPGTNTNQTAPKDFFESMGFTAENFKTMFGYGYVTEVEKDPSKYTNNNTASTKNDIQIIIEGAQYENEEDLAEAIAQKIEEMTQNKRNAVPY